MNVQLVMLVMVMLAVFTVDSKGDQSCVTPNEETATCVAFLHCPLIFEAVASGEDEAIQFFKESKCGSAPGMVCCGSTGYAIKSTPPPQKEKIELDSYASDSTICGLVASSNRIKGGTVAELEEFPWLVALEYYNKYTKDNAGIRCGGSLITDRFVLTAAHCIVHVEFEVTRAWLGATNISSDHNCLDLGDTVECTNSTRKVNVTKKYVHAFYNSLQHRNDIGLLLLENRIQFSKYIRPVCLPKRRFPSPQIGTYLTIAGWGTTENHTQSDIKLKVEVPVQNNSICDEFLEMDEKLIGSDQLCVGGKPGKDSCQGDSGGPLIRNFINDNDEVQWYQVGVVSYGVGCGVSGRPGIYTKVSRYVGWIISSIYTEAYQLDIGDPCTTPDKKTGACVPLSTCQAVFNMTVLRNSSVVQAAAEYRCGEDNEVLVCCKSSGSVTTPNFDTKALPGRTICGFVKTANKDDITQPGEFPWVVGIEHKNKYTGENKGIRCAGSLISNRYVLTSAHCLILDNRPVNVWLGNWQDARNSNCKKHGNGTDRVRIIPVKEAVPYPLLYNVKWYHNVGLIHLGNEVEFTDYIRPICLPFPNTPSLGLGTELVVAAWRNKQNGTKMDGLRKTKVSLVSNEECLQKISYPFEMLSSQVLCAVNTENNNSIIRDTGAPLMWAYKDKQSGILQWYQEGILSYGYKTDHATYSRISSYMDWIIRIISEK